MSSRGPTVRSLAIDVVAAKQGLTARAVALAVTRDPSSAAAQAVERTELFLGRMVQELGEILGAPAVREQRQPQLGAKAEVVAGVERVAARDEREVRRAIARNVIRRREAAEPRITQAMLAEATGTTDETIGRIERCLTTVKLRLLMKIACALRCTLDDLVWTEPRP